MVNSRGSSVASQRRRGGMIGIPENAGAGIARFDGINLFRRLVCFGACKREQA